MDLITTHINADFDALSSVVAASKLYPKSRLLLPGSQEKSVRSFLSLIKDKIKIENEKTCRFEDVTRLIIVDNRHSSRIGEAAVLLNKKDVKVHIYDHHPRTVSDIKPDKELSKKVGATVSIILEILDKKGKLKLTPLEATLMLLGIYEETGSLSYSATTKLDVDMVGKLLACGANLRAVSLYLNRELTGKELAVLIHLLESAEIVNVNGVDVAFCLADASHFEGEMGAIVHKLQDVENYPILFAMFETGKRIKVLARSQPEIVNVHKLLQNFGGAGHPGAAGAKIDKTSYKKLKSDILNILDKVIRQEVCAQDIMSFPVRTISADEKVNDVLEKLEVFGYKGAPVINEYVQLIGMVTINNLKKAIKSGLGHSKVKGYTATPLITASPTSSLHELKDILFKKDKGRIPIIEENKLVGIVTRTDVLKKVHSALFPGKAGAKSSISNLSSKIDSVVPPKLKSLIKTIGAKADSLGVNAFLVGGFVRDVLIGCKNYDLDIVVEGNAMNFAKILADKLKASLVVHKKFGTATIVMEWPKWLGPSPHLDNKFKIDIAMARKETYKSPAALPMVKFSSLREDLYRRDFTINAMATSINKKSFGLFVDFFGGIKDLEKGIIRILHDNSFIDDPTRIFRAVRFEQRFGFKLDKHTEYLVTHAIKREMFKRTENQRIRDELILMLKESTSDKAVYRMRELHELQFIHSDLVLSRSIKRQFSHLRNCVRWYEKSVPKKCSLTVWIMNFMVVLDALTEESVDQVLKKFVFTKEASAKIRLHKECAKAVTRKLSSPKRMSPGEVYDILEPLVHEAILCIMAKTTSERVTRRIKKYFKEYCTVRLKVTGEDIKKEGIKPGPRYQEILRHILHRKLGGALPTKRDELKCMRNIIKGKRV